MGLIVDTDVIVWYMRGEPNAVRSIDSLDSFSISVVTYIELIQGMRNKRELHALKQSLTMWQSEVIQIVPAISAKAASFVERHFLSHAVRLPDALVAATAIERGDVLLTANVKHYAPISDLQIKTFRPKNK